MNPPVIDSVASLLPLVSNHCSSVRVPASNPPSIQPQQDFVTQDFHTLGMGYTSLPSLNITPDRLFSNANVFSNPIVSITNQRLPYMPLRVTDSNSPPKTPNVCSRTGSFSAPRNQIGLSCVYPNNNSLQTPRFPPRATNFAQQLSMPFMPPPIPPYSHPRHLHHPPPGFMPSPHRPSAVNSVSVGPYANIASGSGARSVSNSPASRFSKDPQNAPPVSMMAVAAIAFAAAQQQQQQQTPGSGINSNFGVRHYPPSSSNVHFQTPHFALPQSSISNSANPCFTSHNNSSTLNMIQSMSLTERCPLLEEFR